VASVWIRTRTTKGGEPRFHVEFRAGGREARVRFGGSFATKRLARLRAAAIEAELAALRMPVLVPDPSSVDDETPTLAEAAEAWQASRVDVAEGTALMHRSAIRRALPVLGKHPVDAISPADIARLVATLHAVGRSRETIRKTLTTLAMVLDHVGVEPNPARDRVHVKLPREQRPEIQPPSAKHLEDVLDVLPERYRLPLLVLDATGMRLGELEGLAWGDVDEPRGRWRVSAAVSKTRKARWVQVPPEVFQAVSGLTPREDRTPERRVFLGFGGDRFRTALTRACTTAAVPVFSPHDLRHRRISLLHLRGVPWARIGEHVGQRSLKVTSDTYTHVLTDETELDYAELLQLER
jgi:integrase